MSEQKRSIEEKLQRIHEYNKKLGITKLEADENGVLLLDPSNPHHVEWYEDDDAANLVPDEHLAEYYPELERTKKSSE